MATSRYTIKPDWAPESNREGVIIETATLVDNRSGREYPLGASRVRFENKVDGFRAKTFKGESAWSDAERYAVDAIFAQRRQAPVGASSSVWGR